MHWQMECLNVKHIVKHIFCDYYGITQHFGEGYSNPDFFKLLMLEYCTL